MDKLWRKYRKKVKITSDVTITRVSAPHGRCLILAPLGALKTQNPLTFQRYHHENEQIAMLTGKFGENVEKM